MLSEKSVAEIENQDALCNVLNQVESAKKSEFNDSTGICLTWQNLSVAWTPPSSTSTALSGRGKDSTTIPRLILNDVSGVAKPGDFIAILGVSGSGKTTLLNALSNKISKDLEVDGLVKVNGHSVTGEEMMSMSGYVGQDDVFMGSMTVMEVILFYAHLKLDSRIPGPMKRHMALSILQKVGLSHVGNSLVGDSYIRGISGGEKKRLAVATQLLSGASLLFLDEVTSGLDTFMAEKILDMAKELTESGCTILCTIHQPASELYTLFDKICLISEGSIAFLGSPKDALVHFEEAGYPCPPHYNPTDHFIYTLAIKPGDEDRCRERCSSIVQFYRKSRFFLEVLKGIKENSSMFVQRDNKDARTVCQTKATLWSQFSENALRSFREIHRNPRSTRARFISGIILSVIIASFYFNTSNNIDTVQANKSGLIFLILTTVSFRSINYCALKFPLAFSTTKRECHNGLYSTLPYFLSVLLCEMPFLIALICIQHVIFYFVVGLRRDAGSFFTALACNIITKWASCCVGLFIGAMSGPDTNLAAQIALSAFIPFVICSGLIKSDLDTPIHLYPIKYLSWLRYGFSMMMVNEFKDLELECEEGVCPYNGTTILLDFGINPDELWWPNMPMNVLIGLGFIVLAWLMLTLKITRQ